MAAPKVAWTIRVVEDMDHKVKEFAGENNLTQNAVVLMALKSFFANQVQTAN